MYFQTTNQLIVYAIRAVGVRPNIIYNTPIETIAEGFKTVESVCELFLATLILFSSFHGEIFDLKGSINYRYMCICFKNYFKP